MGDSWRHVIGMPYTKSVKTDILKIEHAARSADVALLVRFSV
jgi:hypothetical protein